MGHSIQSADLMPNSMCEYVYRGHTHKKRGVGEKFYGIQVFDGPLYFRDLMDVRGYFFENPK